MEVLAIIQNSVSLSNLAFFDEFSKIESPIEQIPIVNSVDELRLIFRSNSNFCLGVGNPYTREKMDQQITGYGGNLISIISPTSIIQSELDSADVMSFGFVGPNVKLGRGVLVNTRAHVHHGCEVGNYSEIGPGAILLGNVKIGDKCRIGAGAIILPGISLGNEVVVGAGAVVTKPIESYNAVVGVPAKPFKK